MRVSTLKSSGINPVRERALPGLTWMEIPRNLPGKWEEYALSLLDQQEKKRYLNYTHLEAKTMFLMGRYLAKTELSHVLSCPPESIRFSFTPKGKPHIKGKQCYFSLSHSGQWISLLHSERGAVGVDMEVMKKRDYINLAERFFSPPEIKWLKEDSQVLALRFYQIWTQKEAVLKATGEGLAGRLAHITMPCTKNEERLGSWVIKSFSPAQNIIGAAAVLCSRD